MATNTLAFQIRGSDVEPSVEIKASAQTEHSTLQSLKSASASGSSTPYSSTSTSQSLYSEESKSFSTTTSSSSDCLVIQSSDTNNPYAHWECGFGFHGQLDEPPTISSDRTEFLMTVKDQLKVIENIQSGLHSYIRAIHSGDYHDFDQDFLNHQNNATNVTVSQLQEIAAHLSQIVHEIEDIADGNNDAEVDSRFVQAFSHAQPWIIRSRAILVSAHVFYKINYVLGGEKRKPEH